MYGYYNVFLREPEQNIQRAVSVPVMGRKVPGIGDGRRAQSFSTDAMDKIWQDSKGKPAFSDYLDKQKEPLIPQYHPPEQMKGSTLIPVLVTGLVGMGALLFGIEIGFSSPTNSSIKDFLGATDQQVGLMWSWLNVGAMFGCLSAAPFANFLGRKPALMLSILPFAIGGALFYIFENYLAMSISRFVTGVGVGLASVLVPLYIAETAPTHLRGALGSANQFLIAAGIVLVNAVGLPIVKNPSWWKTMVLLTGVPLLVVFVGLLLVGVETPRYLVSKGKEEEAEKSLRFLRGADYNVGAELHDLLQTSGPSYSLDDEEEFGDSKEAVVKSNTKMNNWSFLFSKALRPLLLGISLQLLQQWSGINAIMFHTSELFVPSTAKSLTPDQQTAALHGAILVNVVQVVMCGVTVLSMNRAGRRFFLILSHIGMGLAGSLMGFAFLWDWSTAARMAIIMAYLAFFSLGVGPIPWLVCSEIYPSQVRELAMSLSTLVNWSSAFAVTAAQAPIRSLVGDQGVFWFFSIVSFFGALLVYLTLPETKDKSLEEIEAYFLGGDEED